MLYRELAELAELKKPLVIVLDDFQTITSEPVPEIIARLVQYLPVHLHLIISTRVDPPLPLLQWRVRNWLREFRAEGMSIFSLKMRKLL